MRTAGDIQRAAGKTLVHRQHEAEAVDAALVAKGQLQGFAEGQAGILHRVVVVDVQIAADVNLHAEAAVGGDLVEHMVKKADAGMDLAAAFAVQPHFHIHLGLFGDALDVGIAVAAGQLLADGRPVERLAVIAQTGNSHVIRQLKVGGPVANHIAVGFIQHALFQPRQHQLRFWLTAGAVVAREVRTNQHLFKVNAL